MKQRLGMSFTGGQYGILKGGIDYNSGLLGGNKSIIARFNYLEGNGWRKNTFYRSIQYYLSAMLFPNERNTFKFILHGAPQYHAYGYYGMNPAFFADKEDFDPDGRLYEFGFTDESHSSSLEKDKGSRQNKYYAWQGDVWVDGMANGHWDASESMVDGADYVKDFGDKIEPGMPQLILGMTANYYVSSLTVGAAYRFYIDNFVFADNREFYIGSGDDDLWDNADDEKTAVLPSAGVIDIRAAYLLDIMSGLNISLHISNLLDTKYWQSGSEYGTAPSAARTVILNLGMNL